jgi:hypothetical protein
VARAPAAQATDRATWRVWDGAGWSPDLMAGQPVLHGAPGEMSVSWNDHLGAFLAVHSVILSDEVVFQTAPHPEGPWSAPRRLFVGQKGPGGNNYAAREHPEVSEDGGRALVVSYAHPLGGLAGDVRLAAPTLP